MDDLINTIQICNCIEAMSTLPEGSVDLAFADPPFNIGYDYDVYEDSKEYQQYIDWSSEWISAVYRVLKPDGTFWLAIGDDYAAELKIESKKAGFHCRSWVIWYYTFGVNCSKKFTRSHTHLFHFVKDRENFTFRDDDLGNRVPSARELVYNDKRANPKGRLPDDTWIIRPAHAVGDLLSDDGAWSPKSVSPPADNDRTYTLRPQDLEHSFGVSEDTWYFPRVAGTFKERAGFHGCQMPEQLLGRIVRTCSNSGDLVLDPFAGSATTLAAAKKLGRRFIGFDISEDYVQYGRDRLEAIRVGDPLDGSAEPTKSAPKTTGRKATKSRAKGRQDVTSSAQTSGESSEEQYSSTQLERTLDGIMAAFQLTHDGFSADRVVADPALNEAFLARCRKWGLAGDARTWNMLLFRLRKQGRLSCIDTLHQTNVSWDECDKYVFASEIAWQMMIDDKSANSLDEILCDPVLAEQFDAIAGRFAAGYESLEYRWAALKLRKEAKSARSRAALLTLPTRLGEPVPMEDLDTSDMSQKSGVYILSDATRKLYAGEALDLHARFTRQCRDAWSSVTESPVSVQTLPMDPNSAGRLAWQSCLVKKLKPRFNSFELRSA